jgi:hypothetical protein
VRPLVVVGLLLILAGALGLAYGGLSYWRRDRIVDLGPIHASVERKETIPVPPIVGGIALAAGVALLLFSNKR